MHKTDYLAIKAVKKKWSVQRWPRHIFNGRYIGDVAEVAHVSVRKLANAPLTTAASGIKAVVCLVSV